MHKVIRKKKMCKYYSDFISLIYINLTLNPHFGLQKEVERPENVNLLGTKARKH